MDNILKYKNFIATVKYSAEDELFIGRIECIDSVVSFEGNSVKELKTAFKDAVESYLDFCQRKGISSPQKSYSGSINIRLNSELHKKIALFAETEGISINSFVKNAVEKQLILENF